ncbi:lipopolysaccharide kinase InaA family protein [Salinicola avicenniae]|uniref:lipopolysaccharide kinase InaA family protein n=1 Tax=Salinicola avicenniae TaxID=2916836 RepID=UPI0020734B35|nr:MULTISPECIES: lipopolysaccharide kinase InaA family protein [unclassified Salinicola]
MLAISLCLPVSLQAPIDDVVTAGRSAGDWRLGDAAVGTVALQLNAVLANDAFEVPGVEVLRRRKGRTAMRVSSEGGQFFAKRIELRPLRKRVGAALGVQNRLFGYDHGVAELDNTLYVARTTGQAVAPLALGTFRRHGLPQAQVLIQPWLEGYLTLGDAWQQADTVGRRRLLDEVQCLIRRFHQVGLCHLDFNPTNVMVAADDPGEMKVIDCARLIRDVPRPDIASALQVGKMLRSLYGRHESELPTRLNQAREMLAFVTDSPVSAEQDALLVLALRYQLSKTISIRRLVRATGSLDLRSLEVRALRSYKNAALRGCPEVSQVLAALPSAGTRVAATSSAAQRAEEAAMAHCDSGPGPARR